MRLFDHRELDTPDYRALQPFAQVPFLEEEGLVLFESGAILLHIAARSEVLLPQEGHARARSIQWIFAALNSVEPALQNLALIDIFFAKEQWAILRRPGALAFAQRRLAGLSNSLGSKSYLDGERFTAGDLMMASVLRIAAHTDLVTSDARLGPYLARCLARPAFQRALAGQLGDFSSAPGTA
jgi:glutathione S-transferase